MDEVNCLCLKPVLFSMERRLVWGRGRELAAMKGGRKKGRKEGVGGETRLDKMGWVFRENSTVNLHVSGLQLQWLMTLVISFHLPHHSSF